MYLQASLTNKNILAKLELDCVHLLKTFKNPLPEGPKNNALKFSFSHNFRKI